MVVKMTDNKEKRTTTYIGTDTLGCRKGVVSEGEGPTKVAEDKEMREKAYDGFISYMWYTDKDTGKREKLGFKPVNYDILWELVDVIMDDVKMLKDKLAEQQKEIERLKGQVYEK